MNKCNDHTNHETQLKRNREDIVKLFQIIDGLRLSVITGMTTLIIGVVLIVLKTYIG